MIVLPRQARDKHNIGKPQKRTQPLVSHRSSADLTVETDYPFDEQVTITVTSDAGLGLALRIPAWAHGASVALANGTVVPAQAGTLFHTRLQLGTVRLVRERGLFLKLP
jgi:hypothetical protein